MNLVCHSLGVRRKGEPGQVQKPELRLKFFRAIDFTRLRAYILVRLGRLMFSCEIILGNLQSFFDVHLGV
jgi:hypothetical protein